MKRIREGNPDIISAELSQLDGRPELAKSFPNLK
jgi:hypothetical protein